MNDAYINAGNKPLSATALANQLFGANNLNEDEKSNALRGLLIIRGLFDITGVDTDAPKLRVHNFFRNVEGIWTSVHSGDNTTPVDTIFQEPVAKDANGNRVLELLYCEKCGTTMWGGKRMEIAPVSDGNIITQMDAITTDGFIEILGNDTDLESLTEKG